MRQSISTLLVPQRTSFVVRKLSYMDNVYVVIVLFKLVDSAESLTRSGDGRFWSQW